MFPIHDDTERIHGRPYLNYCLILVNVIIFIYEVIVTGFFTNERAVNALFQRYGAIPNEVLAGNIPSIFSSMFLHAGIAHLIGNMVFLFVFGDNIEDKFGRIKYLIIYLMWGVAAAITHSLFAVYTGNGATIPAVGASGAISGVLGAYLVMYPKARIYTIVVAFFITTIRIPAIAFIPFWFIMQIALNFFDPGGGVAYMAHVGGFVVGLGTGYLWKTLKFQNPISFQPKWQTFKNRPNMAEMGIGTQPEIIKGPDFYEIIAEVRGLTGIADIRTDYNPDAKIMKIYTPRSNEPEVSVKLPDDASDLKVDQVQYLNGILRIRLVKQI